MKAAVRDNSSTLCYGEHTLGGGGGGLTYLTLSVEAFRKGRS